MPLVSRHCIETIRQNVSIVDVVSPYVSLKRSGSSFKGLSPFSNEKTPSFYVIPEKNIFKCFSSGHAGDIFRFLQLKENISFNDAIETVATRHNQKIEYEDNNSPSGQSPNFSLKKEILELHELANSFFSKAFFSDNPEAQDIRSYWTSKRNFNLDQAKDFSIGYAPISPNSLATWILKQKRFSIEALKDSGLFYHDSRNPNLESALKSRFRGRLMIPIRDVQGRVVAFAGRQLDCTPADDPAREAKYINSPETPIFIKGKTLFGLDHARKHIDSIPYFILVEGQLDALRCRSEGFETTIAPQGTGITVEQLQTLKRYNPNLICILDGDEAGKKAALRLLPLALKAGIDIQFIQLEPGQDPDQLLAQGHKDSFAQKINHPTHATTFMAQSLLAGRKLTDLTTGQKSQLFTQFFEILKESSSKLIQEEYLEHTCRILHTNPAPVLSDFNRFLGSKAPFKRDEEKNQDAPQDSKVTRVEDQLLMLVLNFQDIAQPLSHTIDPSWIDTNAPSANILMRILADIQEEVWTGPDNLDSVIEKDTEKDLIYGILAQDPPFDDPKKTANQCLKSLFNNFVQKKKLSIEEKMRTVSDFQSDTMRELQNERIHLRKLLMNPPQIH